MIQPIYLTTCLAENTEPLCQKLTTFLEAELGRPVAFKNDISWADRAHLLATGSIQIGWICGLLFMRLRKTQDAPLRLLAAPVMRGTNYANRPVYFSHIVVRQDSPCQNFADLRDVRWGYNEPGSFSGYAIVRHHLASIGESDRYFGEWIESGSHLNSLRLLLDGRIQAAAIDSTMLDYWQQKEPAQAKKIRVIGRLGPNPSPPLVVSSHVPASLQHNLRQLLLTLDQTRRGRAILAASNVARFTAVSEQSYQSLYEISQI